MNQKVFANIVSIVVIVVLIGVVGYFAFVKKSKPIVQKPVATQTTNPTKNPTSNPKDETVNWKTYINAYLEVKYPTNYFYFFQPGNQSTYEKFEFANDTDFVGSFNQNSGPILSIQDKIYQKGGYEWPRIEISMSKPTQLSIIQWATNYLKNQRPNIKFSQTTKNINGKDVLIMSAYDSDNGPLVEQHNFIADDSRVVLISCILRDPQCAKILSTFKFVK